MERLGVDDQRRLVRLVDLLAVVPKEVQRHTQLRLRALADQKPETRVECIVEVDGIILYLERSLATRKFKCPIESLGCH